MTKTHGGARPGAGRKPTGRQEARFRLTPGQTGTAKALGGPGRLQHTLTAQKEKTMKTKIDPSDLTDEQREAFVEGWECAGGSMNDVESDTPWCMPWEYASEIEVTGDDPEAWGEQYWAQCRAEVLELTRGDLENEASKDEPDPEMIDRLRGQIARWEREEAAQIEKA